MSPSKEPYEGMSLLDFQKRFPDEDRCWEYLVRTRWPRGKPCSECRKPMGLVETRRIFQCNRCGNQISATSGTLFHKSRVPLQKWFWAIYFMGTTPKGVSMRYLQKHLGIKNYKTVWLMGHKIRQAMIQREGLYRLKGAVQVDTFKLGRQSDDDRRKRREDRHTTFLMGVQEGETKNYPRFVTFEQLETVFKNEVLPALQKRIAKGSRLKSDGAGAFKQAEKEGYQVDQVRFTKEPDRAKDHLKWIHWLSSNLKLGLASTYHGCSPKYRKAYLAEFAYRFNRRYWPRQAFDRLLRACIQGQKITRNELTG
jgi:hypothetical protein